MGKTESILCGGLIYQARTFLFEMIKNVCLINQTPTQISGIKYNIKGGLS